MRGFVIVVCLGCLSGVWAEAGKQGEAIALTKFEKRAIIIRKQQAQKEEEERQLEEDGFCPCSVQIP